MREIDKIMHEKNHSQYQLKFKNSFIEKLKDYQPLNHGRNRRSVLKKIKKSKVIKEKLVNVLGDNNESSASKRKKLIKERVENIVGEESD